MSRDSSQSPDVVTAVIVAHDGAAWIPRAARGVASQTRPVQRVVAVDTGSRDRSGAMLAQVFGRGAVFGMERGTGYAAAVARALRHRAASVPVGPPDAERTEWVWLLHDDCEPAPDALDRLLRSYIGICVRNHDLIAVAASETHHLSAEHREQRRANQRLFISEWVHCLSSVRADLSPAETRALVSGIVGLVSEAARSRRMERRADLAEDLYRLAHAVIYAP